MQSWCVFKTIFMELDGILERAIDSCTGRKTRDNVLKVMLVIACIETYCEKY